MDAVIFDIDGTLSQMSGEYKSMTYYGDGAWDQRATASLGWNFLPIGATLGGLTSYEDLV